MLGKKIGVFEKLQKDHHALRGALYWLSVDSASDARVGQTISGANLDVNA